MSKASLPALRKSTRLDRAVRAAASNWPLYLIEGAGVTLLMVATCGVSVLFLLPDSLATRHVHNELLRHLAMAIMTGCIAVLLIHSPLGRRSGGHYNPAITLAYVVLEKVERWDAFFYVASQFTGGFLGIALAFFVLGDKLAHLPVLYAVTRPAASRIASAFCAEFTGAMLLMMVGLYVSNRPAIARYSPYFIGATIAISAFVIRPISGFSVNPARTIASATFANIWTAVWIYLTAPVLGTICASLLYHSVFGPRSVLCAKLDPATDHYRCPFICSYPFHKHSASSDQVTAAS